MRQGEEDVRAKVLSALRDYEVGNGPLPGIVDRGRRAALVEQLVESLRRRRYIERIQSRPLSPLRGEPQSYLFDPVMAAILKIRHGDLEEAFWLAFLSTLFGRHLSQGWRYCAAIYGRQSDGDLWQWSAVARDVAGFARWMDGHSASIKAAGGGFGNHRKYESLGTTGSVTSSYVAWVGPRRSQELRFREVIAPASDNREAAFDLLYASMHEVARFGRTARFDFLTLVSRLELLPIAPGRAYLGGATGPLRGAKLLFGGGTAGELEGRLVTVNRHLQLGFDILEDALCNWQKSPNRFMPFRG